MAVTFFEGPTEEVVVSNCTMLRGHGDIVFGSEIAGGLKNIVISGCTVPGNGQRHPSEDAPRTGRLRKERPHQRHDRGNDRSRLKGVKGKAARLENCEGVEID